MEMDASMKKDEEHLSTTIIGMTSNNNTKYLIIHPPREEGGQKNVEKINFLPLHKCYKRKLRLSGCLTCKSQPDNYVTVIETGVNVAKWRCGNCRTETKITLRETPPLVPPPHEDVMGGTNSKKKRSSPPESDDIFEVEEIGGDRVTKERGREFLVKWKDYPWTEATWEPRANLAGASEILAAYLGKEKANSDD